MNHHPTSEGAAPKKILSDETPTAQGESSRQGQNTLEDVKKMSDEELRIAVARLDGWCDVKLRGDWCYGYRTPNQDEEGQAVPDYLHDLDAIHEIEKKLTNTLKKFDYANALEETLDLIPEDESLGLREHRNFAYATATARQRCQALVLCLSERGENEICHQISKPGQSDGSFVN